MPSVPRYNAFQPASRLASEIKKRNRAENTRAEVLLRRSLWKRGLRYRLHAALPGKPDIVFRSAKTVIFCDGDFWHGRYWTARRAKLARGTNAKYWIPKIESNIERDRRTTRELRNQGWCVIRVWETDVFAHADQVASRVQAIVQSREARQARGVR